MQRLQNVSVLKLHRESLCNCLTFGRPDLRSRGALWLAWRLIRAHAALKPYALALVGAVGLQWGIGVLNVYLQWPLGLAVLHNTGAALLLAVALVIALRFSGAGASATQTLGAVAPSKG